MKEITRIHLAKTAFDIEIDARKSLEKYLDAIALALDDDDMAIEVEARIVELLGERGVLLTGKGIITENDVNDVKERLGSPKQFLDTGNDSSRLEDDQPVSRRLLRDENNAVLGGVLAGLAAYLAVDVIWLRIAAVVGLFISFGTAILLYIALWLAIPPARTASERLQMNGREATLSALKDMGATARNLTAKNRPWIMALRAVVVIVLLAMAVPVVVLATIRSAHGVAYLLAHHSVSLADEVQYVAMMAGVVLLALLFVLLAVAVWTWVLGKRMAIAIMAVVVAGMVCVAIVVTAAIVRQQGSIDMVPRAVEHYHSNPRYQ